MGLGCVPMRLWDNPTPIWDDWDEVGRGKGELFC